jgi:O-antigen ligase
MLHRPAPSTVLELDREGLEDATESTSGLAQRTGAGTGTAGRLPSVAPMPGFVEQLLVVLTTFVLYHQTPNAWFIQPSDVDFEFSNPLAAAAQLGLMVLAILRVLGGIDLFVNLIRIDVAVFAFAGLALTSIFWSADPEESLRRGVMFVAVTLFASYLVIRFPLERIMTLLAWMFVLSALVNVAWIVAFPGIAIDSLGRLNGIFIQKNALGYINALAVPTSLLAGIQNRSVRWIFFGSAAVHAALLVGSESKTMLVAGLATVGLLPVFHLFRGRKTVRGAVLVSLCGSGVFAIAFSTASIGILARWLDKDVTLTGRVPLWHGLVELAMERPIIGHGWTAVFGGYFSPVHEAIIQSNWSASDAHNAVLQIWLELGVVGVALFVWIYGRAVLRAIRIVAIVPGAVGLWPLATLTIALLVSLTESGMQSDNLGWTMYVVAVLSVGAHLKYRSDLGFSNEIGRAAKNRSPASIDVRADGAGL